MMGVDPTRGKSERKKAHTQRAVLVSIGAGEDSRGQFSTYYRMCTQPLVVKVRVDGESFSLWALVSMINRLQ